MLKRISAGLATTALLSALGAGSLAAQNASVAGVSDRGLAPEADSIAITTQAAGGAQGQLGPSALSAAVGGAVDAGGNTASIQQIGDYNRAFVQQTGRGNVAGLYQGGNGNDASVYQLGNQNVMAAWFFGNDNTFGLTQRGDGNTYVLGFWGSDLDHQVVQEGNGLTAFQLGIGSLPFGIKQRGNGAEVRIEHNPIR